MCTRCIMQMSQMSLLYASDVSFKNSLVQYEKYVWEKSNVAYSLPIRVQTTINHISILTFLCFLGNMNVKEDYFFRARAEKDIARLMDASSVTFYWFVLSMRMQVILDSSFARPGSAPIRDRKKGEFRDWTKNERVSVTNE